MTAAMAEEYSTPQAYLSKRAAEFFAGVGLMRMGLERGGWSVVYANDICEKKQTMYESHFGGGHFDLRDIHHLIADDIPDVELATASFPCTDLSLAGGREGLKGKQSSAFWGFTSLLDGMDDRRPPIVLIENVPAFITSHNGADFREAMLELNRLGYVVDPFVMNAAWFVPQSRERLFVVGTKQGTQGEVECPLPMTSKIRPKRLVDYIMEHSDIRWFLHEFMTPVSSSPNLSAVLEDLPDDDERWWSASRSEYLLSQMSARHRIDAERLIENDGWSYGTVFRRMRKGKSTAELRTDGIAGCLRTPKGGSAKQILFRMGNGRYSARWLTPRECARLMGADDYNIGVNDDEALFGFGDAVCVSVVEWIAKKYLNPLACELADV